jgi:hypothetical protein
MPFVSKKQARFFNANRSELEKKGVDVGEWNRATDFSSLPERSSKMGWMQKESKREKRAGTKGVFSAAAARAGKSTQEYAEEKKSAPGKTGRRARMALAYMGARH